MFNQDQDQQQEITYDNAFPFDVIRYREVDIFTDTQIRNIIDTVWTSLPSLPKPKIRKKYREMVKNYVLNLLKSYQTKKFIRISRNRNDHFYDERYCHIHTTASIVINTMNSLRDYGWIDIHVGFYDRQKQFGKQTRISPSKKFIDLIEQRNGLFNGGNIKFTIEDNKELVQLRKKINDDTYKLIPYTDTYITKRMRERLNQYNDLMRSVLTILPLSRKELSTMNDDLITMFNNLLLNGSIEFNSREIDRRHKPKSKKKRKFIPKELTKPKKPIIKECTSYNVFDDNDDCNIDLKQQPLPEGTPETSPTAGRRRKAKDTTITNTLTQHDKQKQTDRKNLLLSEDEQSGEVYYSIDEILKAYPKYRIFKFIIHHKNVYRAFSDSDKKFNHHGRFYGDIIQSLPKWMRVKITMRRKEVVECDFVSIHPTMLYVMAGAVPPDNIYMIDKETDPQLRKEYKTVLLVSINHKDPHSMWSAVSCNFREDFGYKAGDVRLTKKYIEDIYNKLLLHNQPIAQYMNTGVAMALMKKDSEIADRIIKDFVWRETPIRCIHDSFIVPAGYENWLKKLMVKYFQEVMNTDYIIRITTEKPQEKAPECPILNDQAEMAPVTIEEVNIPVVAEYDDNIKYFEKSYYNQPVLYSDKVSKICDIEEETEENMKYFEDIDDNNYPYDNPIHEFSRLAKERVLLGGSSVRNGFEGVEV